MELKTNDLAKALNMVAIVIERCNTIPILSHVHISSEDTLNATFQATNLDQELTVMAPMMNGSKVRACFDRPDALARLIRASAGETVTIDTIENGKANLRAGELAGVINTLTADDYPVMTPAFTPDFEAELGAAAVDMIIRVSGAMSSEETRYYLNGVFFQHIEGWTYRAAATDGHRLYMGTIELPNARGARFAGKGKDGGIIIPKYAIRHLIALRRFAKKDTPVMFRVGAKRGNGAPSLTEPAPGLPMARFSIDCHGFPAELTTKLIDGTYPDYMRVVPDYAETEPQVVFRRADLRRALDGITAGMTEKTRAVKLTFDGDKLIVSAKWIDTGFDGKIAIPAKTNSRTPFEIGFNGGYLRSLIDASRGDELVLVTHDSSSPGSIVDPAGSDFRAVLMPMRV